MKRTKPLLALALPLVALVLTSCGDSKSETTTTTSSAPAVTANATDLTKEPTIAKGSGKASEELITKDLVVGTGTAAVAADTVNVRYVGSLYSNGTVFDSSWSRGTEPTTFPLANVVPGFAEGIVGMKPGGRREIVIPSALGYKDEDNGPIPANSTLVFIVDLVSTGAAK